MKITKIITTNTRTITINITTSSTITTYNDTNKKTSEISGKIPRKDVWGMYLSHGLLKAVEAVLEQEKREVVKPMLK